MLAQLVAALIFTLALVTALAGFGCTSSGNPLLSELHLDSNVVSPNGREATQPVTVGYRLGKPAVVTAYLVSEKEDRLFLEKEEVRPVAGSYIIPFDGSYLPNVKGAERRVLPEGEYTLVVEARNPNGGTQQSRAKVRVRDPDTHFPAVRDLTLTPQLISPNFDGIDDLLHVRYRTTKKATITLYAQQEGGKRFLLEKAEGRPSGEQAGSWDGMFADRLLPSGPYQLVVEARDMAGNVALESCPFRIDSAAMPEAQITSVIFTPQRLEAGGTVKLEIRVRNRGNTVLRSHGPAPGFSYSSRDSYDAIQSGAFQEKAGYWRVGIDWSDRAEITGSKYPYRWGLGKDLAPGEEVTVVGFFRIDHRYPRLWLFAGLLQEQIRQWDREVGRTFLEIVY